MWGSEAFKRHHARFAAGKELHLNRDGPERQTGDIILLDFYQVFLRADEHIGAGI